MRALVFLLMLLPSLGMAQDRRPSHCIALAEATDGIEYLQQASFHAIPPENSLRLTYIDHSTFLLQTAGGITLATDYTGYMGLTDFVPQIVTMNHAHSSHWTAFPPEGIDHILLGWGDGTTPADHHLDLGEMLIRNVPTDIRSPYETGIVEKGGNSIFVFEVAGLCVGHLGHLHHEPDPAQYAALGRLDVVMAAVDGGLTVELPIMLRILKRLRASVVIPMHWFGEATLQQFLNGMEGDFAIRRDGRASLEVSLASLPPRPTVVVLEPRFPRQEDF